MEKAAVYARVSTVEQAEKGYSLQTQLEACRQKAADLDIKEIEEFVDDGYSGEYIDRPALTALRARLAEFARVIVYDPDRLARNLTHQLLITDEIEGAGAELLFVSVSFEHSPEGKLFYSIRGAISAYEKEKIKERSLRGKRGKAAKGKIIADAKPFGYVFDKQASNYTVNESEAAIVRQMFHWLVDDRVGTATVCKRLNEQGIPSPRLKKPWIVSAVYRMLTNPLYKGTHVAMRYRYQKTGLNKRMKVLRPQSEWIEVPVPPIVDEALWAAAQEQLKANKSQSTRNLKHEQLLNGLVFCARCGRKMTIAYSGKAADPKSYYICMSQRSNTYLYSDPNERCTARRIPAEILDRAVYEHLSRLSENPRLIKQYVLTRPNPAGSQNLQTALERLRDNEARLLKQREMVLRWYRQQMITDEDAERQLADIQARLGDISQSKAKVRTELTALSSLLAPSEVVATIQAHFGRSEPLYEEKRAAIRSVLEKVTVERKDSTRARGSKPDLHIELKFL
ncbi:MAG TPA: recombinase family protein [Selenomonadales bacterium]|nr:recombinase family protein [Selenomonadales bacterium]